MVHWLCSVSYTHLDVYKRQLPSLRRIGFVLRMIGHAVEIVSVGFGQPEMVLDAVFVGLDRISGVAAMGVGVSHEEPVTLFFRGVGSVAARRSLAGCGRIVPAPAAEAYGAQTAYPFSQ